MGKPDTYSRTATRTDSRSLPAAVVEVFRYSSLSYRFLNNQSPGSPRKVYDKLDAEWKRTEALANKVRSINPEELQNTFPPDRRDRIFDALDELRHNYEKFSSKFGGFDLAENTLPNVGIVNKDYDDLENLLSNLTAANDALQQKTHPPSTDLPTSRKASSRRRRQPTPESRVSDMILNQRSIRPSFIPSVQTIHGTICSMLVTISVRRSDPRITRSASRLKLWGAGLFEMAVPLDTVFDSDKEAFRPVRQCILRILADILVWTEQELNKLSHDVGNPERHRDSQSAEQVTALLGTDELIPMALESWKDSVEQHEYVQAGGVFNTHYNPIPGLVEVLFDLLPALRAMRRTYCSRLAEAEILNDNGANPLSHQLAATTSAPDLATRRPNIQESFISERPIFDESYVSSADMKFEQVNDIFKKLDKIAKTEGKSPYTRRLQSERESLQRFHIDRRSRKGLEAKDLEDIFEKQNLLVKQLSENHTVLEMTLKRILSMLAEFITENSSIPDPSVPSVSLGILRKRQRKLHRDHTMRAESFLSFLTDMNWSMRNIMPGRGQMVEGSQQ